MPTPPSYQDGLTALTNLTALCLNTGATYICFDGTPGEAANTKKFTDQAGQPLGSDTRVSFIEGALNLQLKLATDPMPRPGYIFSFNGGYYVAGKMGPKFQSNTEVKFSVAVIAAVNPILPDLLSAAGQIQTATCVHAIAYAGVGSTGLAVKNSTGAITYAATGLPAGMAINSDTGAITGTPTTAGTYNLAVTATDGTTGLVGVGFLTLTVT